MKPKNMNIKRYALMVPMLLAGALSLTECASAGISYSRLPLDTRRFIELYFPAESCVSAARVRDAGQPTYEVLLDNGTHLGFDAQGRWTRVECRYSPVPAGIVPEPISGDLAGRYPDAVVCKIAWEYGGYELSIGNGLDLIYAADGTFICEERP